MQEPNCVGCEHFRIRLHAKEGRRNDSRCTHYLAFLGREVDKETGKVLHESYMTVSEARLPPSPEKTHGVASNNFCGPQGRYFKVKVIKGT
jgi:hypothetical protein